MEKIPPISDRDDVELYLQGLENELRRAVPFVSTCFFRLTAYITNPTF